MRNWSWTVLTVFSGLIGAYFGEKIRESGRNPYIRICPDMRLYATGNDLGCLFSCSPSTGDTFCTVARIHNSFSGDSSEFGTFFVKSIAIFGDDPNPWNILRPQNILPATKKIFFEISISAFTGKKNHVKILPRSFCGVLEPNFTAKSSKPLARVICMKTRNVIGKRRNKSTKVLFQSIITNRDY